MSKSGHDGDRYKTITHHNIGDPKLIGKNGVMDKSAAAVDYNLLNLIILHHFFRMSKKFVFFVAEKSRKKVVFSEANNATNAMFST